MRRFYLAGLFSGFIGGLLAAYVVVHVERTSTSGNLSAGPIVTHQEVLSAQRIWWTEDWIASGGIWW